MKSVKNTPFINYQKLTYQQLEFLSLCIEDYSDEADD